MKGTRYSMEQIIRIPGEVEGGRAVAEASQQGGGTKGAIHR